MILIRYDRDPGPEAEGLIRRAIYKANPGIITLSIQTL